LEEEEQDEEEDDDEDDNAEENADTEDSLLLRDLLEDDDEDDTVEEKADAEDLLLLRDVLEDDDEDDDIEENTDTADSLLPIVRLEDVPADPGGVDPAVDTAELAGGGDEATPEQIFATVFPLQSPPGSQMHGPWAKDGAMHCASGQLAEGTHER